MSVCSRPEAMPSTAQLLKITIFLAGLMTFSAPLRAESSAAQVALAETLYQEARELMAAEDYAAACPKFAESQRLDPATGTLLNLAACHERLGRVATAWLEYSDAIVAAKRDGRLDRVKFAEERMAAILPKLPRLTLTVPPEADLPNLELYLDGAPIGIAARDVPTPLDPGQHEVVARANDKVTWTLQVEIQEGEQKAIAIPKLQDIKTEEPPPAPTPSPQVQKITPPTPRRRPPERTVRPTPTSVYVAGAATVALGIATGITSGMYLNQRSDYQRGLKAKEDYETLRDERAATHTLGLVNVSLFTLTLAGAALTSYFYATRPEQVRDRSSARLSPYADRHGGGLAYAGVF